MERHAVGGVVIMLAMLFYFYTVYRAGIGKKHAKTAIIAVTLDTIGSLIMGSGSEGIYLIENFEKLNIYQIFHLVVAPIALLIMVAMLVTGFMKRKVHKKFGRLAMFIWIISALSGFLMINNLGFPVIMLLFLILMISALILF